MVLNDLKRGTTLCMEISSNLKWSLNENSKKLLLFEFEYNLMKILLETSNFDETWTRDLCLSLDGHSTHRKEFEVSN
jgi:hypothetical protein